MHPLSSTGALSPWQPGIFSLTVYSAVVLTLVLVLLFVSRWLGQRKPSEEKMRPYESGIVPTGPARLRFPVPFFMVAIFFLLFDVEGVFIFSWAIAGNELGWTGWLEITFFIFILLGGLIYVWVKGGLVWGPNANVK